MEVVQLIVSTCNIIFQYEIHTLNILFLVWCQRTLRDMGSLGPLDLIRRQTCLDIINKVEFPLKTQARKSPTKNGNDPLTHSPFSLK